MELTNFNSEQIYSSLFLVEQINVFRKEEGNEIVLLHKSLLSKIEKEFDEEIAGQNILPSSYLAGNGKQEKCYELTFEQSLQILMSESKTVRKRVIEVLKEQQKQLMEAKPKLPVTYKDALKQLVAEIEEKEKLQEENLFLIANNENLAIELDEHKAWYSVKRVCLLGYFKNKDAKTLWQPLKTYSIANNYQIKGIFDANYGEVKTYHKEVWKAVYNINL